MIGQVFSDPSGWYKSTRQRFWRMAPTDPKSVRLTHNRIYILPTSRGWAFAFTLVLMLLTSMNYGLSLGYAMTFLLGGLMHAGMLHTYRNLSRLVVDAAISGENEPAAFCGEHLVFQVSLRNLATWGRHGVKLAAAGGFVENIDIPAEGTKVVELRVATKRRGRLALGRLTLDTTYPLGLWRAWAYVHFPLHGLVYPQPETNPPQPPAIGAGEGANGEGSGDDELSGLRTYQPGDPLPRVAWKTAARGLGLFTKEFEGSAGADLRVSWWDLPPAMQVEERLSRMTAWVVLAAQRGQQFVLYLPGATLAAGRGEAQRGKALAMLALHDLGE
jgi:uncharacterized protein (DUF58 family)